ncbi:MAG: DivIVA domain-containing protein [Oscillospiraceae bacterium]
MLTPQQVAKHSFGKSAFSGYNMAAVDDFLDEVTHDYETIYNDNTLLKQKLGVLSDKIREYQSTEDAMRKTLLAAQNMAEQMVKEAETKRDALVHQAEVEAAKQIDQLHSAVSTEEHRLAAAQKATNSYVAEIKRLCEEQVLYIAHLDQLVPPAPTPVEQTVTDIEAAVRAATQQEDTAATAKFPDDVDDEPTTELPDTAPDSGLYGELLAQREGAQSSTPTSGGEKPIVSAPIDIELSHSAPQEPADPDATRRLDRFSDLDKNFGRDYEA